MTQPVAIDALLKESRQRLVRLDPAGLAIEIR
jgi:hypothetical protein